MRRVIDGLLAAGTAAARSDGQVHTLFPVAIGGAEGDALRRWVTHLGAVSTVEVGLGYGLSTLFICEGLLMQGDPHAHHVAMDPYQRARFGDCGLQFLEDAGVAGMVEHLAEESQLALPRLVERGSRFDMAFVDGNHRFDGVFVDLAYLGRLVNPGGIVFVDDLQLPAVVRAVAFFVNNLGWRIEDQSDDVDGHAWAVVRTSEKSDTRRFDYFVDF